MSTVSEIVTVSGRECPCRQVCGQHSIVFRESTPRKRIPWASGKIGRIVDRVGSTAHVEFPTVAARFATAAGLFFSTEGTADFCTAGADVHVGDAAIGTGGRAKQFCFADIVGENRRRKSLRHTVVDVDGFVEIACIA